MKEFFKNLLEVLFSVFIICLILFACVNTESGNFEVLPACFLILLSCVCIIYLIARHNTKKINKEHEKKERGEHNLQFINNMAIVNEACEQQRKKNYIENYKKETSSTFEDSKHSNNFDDSVEKFKIDYLCSRALYIYTKNTSHN